MRASLFFVAFTAPTLTISAQTCDLGQNGYYQGVEVTDRVALHNLLQSTHQQVPFSATPENDVWDALIDLDGDASGTLIRLIYKDTEHDNTPGIMNSYNREHLWPRQRGVGYNGQDYSDVHAIRAAFFLNKAVREDRYFSNCGIAHPQALCTSPAGIDFADTTEIDETTFAPPMNKRGDIARALFYMVLRYDGGEANIVDLQLTDCPTGATGEYGYLSQLLQWHMDDPVDAVEQERNDKACRNWQGNRNPFVDLPSLVHTYFGYPRTALGDGLGYDCSQPNPTKATVLHTTGFENGWDGWTDGGYDSYRSTSSYCKTGSSCIRLRDNEGKHSSMTRNFGDLSSYNALRIDFSFYAYQMETGEDFLLEIANDVTDDNGWTVAKDWVVSDDFVNNEFNFKSAEIDSSILPEGIFGNKVYLRFRCDASTDNDRIYIDDVTVMGLSI